MTQRWLQNPDAPESAKLLGSLPALDVSPERTRELERQLRSRLHEGPSGWAPRSLALKVALALAALGGVAAAATLGLQAFDSTPPSVVVDAAPSHQTAEGGQKQAGSPSREDMTGDPVEPAATSETETEPSSPARPDTRVPRVERHNEHLVVEAVKALKQDREPARARQLAERYLAETPDGPLAKEAREVVSRAKLQAGDRRAE